jgi:hypothetical protein
MFTVALFVRDLDPYKRNYIKHATGFICET